MRASWITIILATILTACSGKQDSSEALPTCLEDLAGHTVAVPGGGATDLLLSKYEGINLMRIGIGEMALAVKSGRAEYAMIQEDQYDATKMDQQGFRKHFNGIFKGSVAVAFRIDEEKVCDDFNQFLREMRASGEYDKWHHDWLQCQDSMVVEAVKMPIPHEGKKITVGITIVFPYIFLSNETLSGMEVDLFNRFCLSKGYCPEYEIIQFPALIPSLNTHKIDAILSSYGSICCRQKSCCIVEKGYSPAEGSGQEARQICDHTAANSDDAAVSAILLFQHFILNLRLYLSGLTLLSRRERKDIRLIPGIQQSTQDRFCIQLLHRIIGDHCKLAKLSHQPRCQILQKSVLQTISDLNVVGIIYHPFQFNLKCAHISSSIYNLWNKSVKVRS